MANMTNYLESGFASHIFGTNAFSQPATIAVALTSTVPDDTDTGASSRELPNAGAYARQALAPGAENWTDLGGKPDGIVYNLQIITFPVATADWGWVSGILICDSATYAEGNALIHGSLTTPKKIDNGDQLKVNVSGISCQFL